MHQLSELTDKYYNVSGVRCAADNCIGCVLDNDSPWWLGLEPEQRQECCCCYDRHLLYLSQLDCNTPNE